MSDTTKKKSIYDILDNHSEKVTTIVWNKLSEEVKKRSNIQKIFYRTAFTKYLTQSEKNTKKLKTLLYGNTPVHLYSFYESNIICNKDNKYHEIDTYNINDVLKLGNRLIITGHGGSGKSMMMRHFFLDTIKNTTYIPILIELRHLNSYSSESISLEKFIYKNLEKFGFTLDEDGYKESLKTGCYVFLLDGYDEVKNNLANKVYYEIKNFIEQYSDNHIIVSSRPLDEFTGWASFKEYTCVPFTKTKALKFINKINYDKDIKTKFYNKLKSDLYDDYDSFASNPLLLTLMLITYNEGILFPDNINEFYELAFSTLFYKHDATKPGRYEREVSSKLSYDQFKKVFSHFCFKSFFNEDYHFSENTILNYLDNTKKKTTIDFDTSHYLSDMRRVVCVIVKEGLTFRFTHRSFQEYFAALYTTQLTDEHQNKFFSKMFDKDIFRLTNDYFDILYNLQPDRFIHNIVLDPLNKLYNIYKDNNDTSDEVFNKIYKLYNSNNDAYVMIIEFIRYYLDISDTYKDLQLLLIQYQTLQVFNKLFTEYRDDNESIRHEIIRSLDYTFKKYEEWMNAKPINNESFEDMLDTL